LSFLRPLAAAASRFGTLPSTAAAAVSLLTQQPVQQVALFSASLQATQQPVMDRSLYTVPTDAPVTFLACGPAFEKLSQAEKAYAYHLYRASWIGGLICLHQTSAESPGLFLVLQSVFRRQTPEQLRAACKAGVSDADWDAFLMYATQVLGNLGNYKSFGDTKILPDLSEEALDKIITVSEAHASSERVRVAWQRVRAAASSLTERNRQLGLGTAGVTAYFSDNCDESDAKLAQAFLDSRQISAYNTRLFKSADGGSYRIVQAAAESSVVAEPTDFTDEASGRSGKFSVERGGYRELMSLALPHLRNAEAAALNANQAEMLRRYAASFAGGSIDEHKAGSRAWIRDKGPAVETYMGFIESYRDPFGVRGEFESFVAVVNKEQSAKFNALVSNAEKFLSLLPWPAAYEKDKFLQPDFTALEIVTFANSGVPLGINIPNYDDIRQSEGFKNVSLANVLSSSFSDPKTTFLVAEDKDIWIRRIAQSFEVQVGLHELLGHGSGKLFKQDSDGKFNFDPSSVVDLVTGKPVASWYKVGETWDGKFSNLASAFEECRAECVGVYLCDVPEVLAVFGHPDKAEADEVIYVNWLCMARAGVASLEMYSPENGGTWRQAHSRARFAILRALLEAGQGLVTIDEITGEDGKPDLTVRLDRSKISSVAKPAIGEFLKRLQSFKSTCSVEAGREFFESYSTVDAYFQRLRDIVIARRKPRRVFIQANLSMDSAGSVSIVEYSDGPAEMIRSFRDRFSDEDWGRIEEALWQQWERDLPLMKLA
ncbi:hypothetical protein BOX15_Mlig003174g5, partial [Macrostomum lignano]